VTTRDAPAAGVDACALLPEAEITALIEDNEHEAFTSDMSDSACKWENKTTYYSVTLSVGSHGTAAPDLAENEALLGPAEPIGDGMQFRAGQVEFVVGDRLCYLNVAIEPNSLGDRDQAARLAPMVRDRLAAGGS
jgi:hypothetical protein